MAQYALGVDLGGTSLKAGLVHRERGLVHEERIPTDAEQGPESVLDALAGLIAHVWAALPEGEALAGVGLGAPGAVALDRATVTRPPNFPGWDRIHVPDALCSRLDLALPVLVENDANVAGLGSAFYGAGRAFRSFLMVTLGTGVGGAILHEGRLFRGTTGGAGEIGHVSVDYEGPPAGSGVPGAVEAYLGQRFLSGHARAHLRHRPTRLRETAGADLRGVTPKKLYEAAEAGDEAARAVLAWAGHKLGCALGSAVNLLDIRKVVVGGGVSHAGDWLLEPARQALLRHVHPALRDGVELVRETLGNEVALLGAAQLVFEHDEDQEAIR